MSEALGIVKRRDFKLEFVGDRFDGVTHTWVDFNPPQEPPEMLYVGTCPGDGTCYGSKVACLQLANGKPHVSYWAPEEGEDGRPPECLAYRRSSVDEEALRAVYVRGDVDALGEWRDEVALDAPGPLVTAEAVREAWDYAVHDARRTQPYYCEGR